MKTTGRRNQRLVVVALGLCSIVCLKDILHIATVPAAPAAITETRPCPARFVRYTPSLAEAFWYERRDLLSDQEVKLCTEFTQQEDVIDSWLTGISDILGEPVPFEGYSRAVVAVNAKSESGASIPTNFARYKDINHTIFSRLEYIDDCSGTAYERWLEPLAGLFRHPRSVCGEESVLHRAHVEDRSYMLLGGAPPETIKAMYPGKRYLFDFGTFRYSSSLSWLIDSYNKLDLQFDGIYAWEANPMDPSKYWEEVPSELQSVLHLYNVPLTTNLSDPKCPMNVIKRLYRPGDFVALKLDIDNTQSEFAIVSAILADPALLSAVSEMFFEMHFRSRIFGDGMQFSWADVMNEFTKLRQKGLHIHYWP